MHDVQKHERSEHHAGIENVLVGFVLRDGGVQALGVLDQAEDDADLGCVSMSGDVDGIWTARDVR